MKNLKFPALMLLGSVFCSHASAGIIVDGDIDDWLAKGGQSTWTVVSEDIQATVEDQEGRNAFYLNPGWGGQAYDAEALFATIQGDKLYIALATGHNPWTLNKPGSNSYGAGDFAFDFGKNGSYDAAININFATAYDVKTKAYSFENTFVEGALYKNVAWDYGLWSSPGVQAKALDSRDKANPTSILSGTYVGKSDLKYTKNDLRVLNGDEGKFEYGASKADKHYFYEMSIDTSLLTEAGWDGKAFNIHWTENCANDSIIVDPPSAVPEPGSLALLGIGLFGVIGMRRRKQNG